MAPFEIKTNATFEIVDDAGRRYRLINVGAVGTDVAEPNDLEIVGVSRMVKIPMERFTIELQPVKAMGFDEPKSKGSKKRQRSEWKRLQRGKC